jgi:UTP--glucose-1-phosphate uridylyltransferase
VILPDVIVDGQPGALKQLAEVYAEVGGNVIGVEQVPESETHKYGIVDPEGRDGRHIRMKGMVEKPPRGEAPSNLSISGRYILQPEIFAILENQPRGAGGEIQLTDGMARLMTTQSFTAVEYEGVTHDCGDKIGLLKANVALALKRADLGDAARAAISSLL